MGTNWRSKAFHDVWYKNLKDAGFADRIAWIRAAAASRPRMDLSRIGCYGSSVGGQNAAAAVIHHRDFYKVAVALSGCHDNRLDTLQWSEVRMGYPVDVSYEASSKVTHAEKLGGLLMLVAGELDTNVDPASTLRLADALIKADKEFDLVFVPGGTHYVDEVPLVQKKRDVFFKRHPSTR
ncbi:peptidase S9, prolyl oligopeptidase [Emericellopsis atlantica]|uniref:Peptidase S9, prolyl oligopeptidase n=1 Tax=Emericellopsis atlantica TaxID=2614577 RepID=A0A9P8CRU5_9HYPO|nr:peptidase S9, prolyl oligopeptidase [Emericellopsis atlantica]KAG9257158.1 peptidase S9, prolyl oligopeptidase [Emericellopsis atlantica]